MQYYYGSQMPLRVLDEAESWKKQELKHTDIMLELINPSEKHYVEELNRWRDDLDTTHEHVKRYVESVVRHDNQLSSHLCKQILELVAFCREVSVAFTAFSQELVTESETVNKNSTVSRIQQQRVAMSNEFIQDAKISLYENLTSLHELFFLTVVSHPIKQGLLVFQGAKLK